MDFISDNNPKHLNKVQSLLGEFPEYVKSANLADRPNVARGSFANSINKEFPMDTPENTFLSYAYLKSASMASLSKGLDPSVLTKKNILTWENKLIEAAQIHGISEDLEKVSNAVEADKEKNKPSANDRFALIIDFKKEGGLKYYYPIDTRENLENSARELVEDISRVPLEAFRTASHNIVKKAKLLKVPSTRIPDKVRRTGADRDFNEKIATHAANQRSRKFGEDAGNIYLDIVKAASTDTQNLGNYINLFMDLDRVNNVDYSNGTLNPYEAFYSGVEKEEIEKAANRHVLLAEVPVPVEEIEKSEDLIKECFNKEDQEELLSVVSLSKEGGIKAAMRIMDIDGDLQKRYLKALAK